MSFDIVAVHEHYEVYINGEFYCSADTASEAARDVKEFMSKHNE